MPDEIENYTPQIFLKNRRKQAIMVWSIFAFLTAAWIFLILIAPIAEANNLTNISSPIYKFFSYLCHQMPSRSFHLENHSFAVCTRCFGVYFGLLFGFIVYPFFRSIEEIEPLSRFWLFLALIPMGIDWSLGFFGVWENTHFSRFLTGLVLGTACAIFIIPALIELAQLLSSKRQVKRLSR
ncbi:MAG: DUF2085 domain-containing protein [Pyrinomonadaceae bacterium]